MSNQKAHISSHPSQIRAWPMSGSLPSRSFLVNESFSSRSTPSLLLRHPRCRRFWRFMLRKRQGVVCSHGSSTSIDCVSKKHAEGALLGVFVGDAAGATLEFQPGLISEVEARRAMKMPGGGLNRVGRGQVTDDSELTIALADGLISAGPHAPLSFPAHHVSSQYKAWYESRPFDAGVTCSSAFSINIANDDPTLHSVMQRTASTFSMESEANGALMRIIPVALWTAANYYRYSSPPPDIVDKDHSHENNTVPTTSISTNLVGDEIVNDGIIPDRYGGQQQPLEFYVAEFARQDALLSHPNKVTQDTNAAYAVAVAHLITHPGDYQGAIAKAERCITNNPKVLSWFHQESIADLQCTHHQGHVRYAFTLAFYFLRHRTPFEDAISLTLQKGGDTDTNAAIVGGLLGALHGAEAIPSFMKNPVLAYDGKSGRRRPDVYRPGVRMNELVENLIMPPWVTHNLHFVSAQGHITCKVFSKP